jgi:hypothetical protein
MSAPLPLHAGTIPVTRTGLLAAASAVVATASVAVTLAVSTGGGAADAPSADGQPAIAKPDGATLYHRSADRQSQPVATDPGARAAEHFHHFR